MLPYWAILLLRNVKYLVNIMCNSLICNEIRVLYDCGHANKAENQGNMA